jgi:hypothetical protein
MVTMLRPDARFDDLAQLDKGYRERYQERVKDVERRMNEYARQLQRELRKFRKLLFNEGRAWRRERR